MEDEPFDKKFPLSRQVSLDHGSKPVSALGLDPAGARLITGCYGYEVRFWDFAGMDTNLQSFRSLTPCECHPICCVQYNHTGELILVASGNAQAVVLDRNGQTVLECPKGWQYIADMTNTNGHISMINNACWHPFLREQFITCSNDCTIRVWDINEEKKQLHVIKSRTKQGKKSPLTTCTYSKDGKYIAGAQLDGSILLWKTVGGSFVRITPSYCCSGLFLGQTDGQVYIM
jgi:WD40 repeat protein